jgi:hypothetical protein
MRQLQLKLHVLTGILVICAFFALIPAQSQAANMSYGNWEVDGFFRNNTGVWTENWDYAPNNDPLATCRNWFRLNLNGKISKSLRLKAEVLGVYETEYSREHGATEAGLTPIRANEYNQFDFREMRLDWRPKMGHNIRFGKQIVNWGESISARVGDVVNPQDARFDLGFTNLEDSRMPIWMVRGLHQFYNIGTSIDWIVSPYMQPDRYRASRTLASPFGLLWSDGSVNPVLGALGKNTTGGQRFAPQPTDTVVQSGNEISQNQLYSFNLGTGTFTPGGPILYTPQNSMYQQVTAADLAAGGGTVPVLTSAFGAPFLFPVNTPGYYLGDLNSAYGVYPGESHYPSSSLKDSRWGFKTSSTIMGAQTGVYFFHRHRFTPVVRKVPVLGGFRFDTDYIDEVDTYGAYANKNFDFGVLRTDIAYIPDYVFNTSDFANYADGVVEKDRLLFQVGYNKDFLFTPLNENQTFGLILEYVGEYILDDELDDAQVTFVVNTPKHKDDHTLMASIGTNYNFGMYAPSFTILYNLRNSGLMQPSFSYNPDWMNRKWSFKLQYNMVFGKKLETGYGLVEEKDLIVLTTQFSFP